MILDKDLNAKKLNQTIENLVQDKKKLKQMGEKAKSISISQVEQKIYKEIRKVVK